MKEKIKHLVEETVKNSIIEHSTSFVVVNIVNSDGTTSGATITIPTEFCEKFAELIIKECTDRISKWDTAHIDKNGKIHYGNIGKDIVDDINQYFGI